MADLKVGDIVHMQDDLDRIERKFRNPADAKKKAQRIADLRTYTVVRVGPGSVEVADEGGRSRVGHPDQFPRPEASKPKPKPAPKRERLVK